MRVGFIGVLVVGLVSCVADSERGSAAGESCTRTADCNAPLRCVVAICVEPALEMGLGDGGVPDGGGMADGGAELDQRVVDAAPPMPPLLDDTYLIALAASIDSSQPLLFVGWPDVSDDAVPRLRLRIQALTADAERMPVGETFEAQADWAADGVTLDFGRITIDGAADPIIPGAPIEADVRLIFQGTEPPCGIIEGNIIQPAAVPLDGTWGSVAVDAGAYAGVELITRCP